MNDEVEFKNCIFSLYEMFRTNKKHYVMATINKNTGAAGRKDGL